MADIKPFKGLRPQSQFAHQVATLPYDVCSRTEAAEQGKNEYNFYHITRSEIDLPDDLSPYDEQVYLKAKENLENFINQDILVQDNRPAYYLYELTMNGRTQTGLLCTSSVKDYNEGIIKKHEYTRPKKEQDRIKHITVTKAQTGIVFLAYKDVPTISDIFDSWKGAHRPTYDILAEDNVTHKLWVVDDEKIINDITDNFNQKVANTYIADGHHRAASAAKVAAEIGAEYKGANYFLTCIFPESEVKILDYNRVVKDLNGLTVEDLIVALKEKFTVNKFGKEAYRPVAPHHYGMYVDGDWYELIAKDNIYDVHDPIDVLDVQVLQKQVLTPILDIDDPRTNDRVDFVGGIRGLGALADMVNEGVAAVAFSCYPVSMNQLLNVADSGSVMPPKSTWFEPKTRDGLVTYLIEKQ